MKSSLVTSGATIVDAATVGGVLDILNAADGLDNSTTDNTNVTREIYRQMLNHQIERFQNLTDTNYFENTYQPTGSYSLPFAVGDSIRAKMTINPATGQEDLTGVSTFGGRSYEIIFRIVANGTESNVEPATVLADLSA